MRNVIAPNLALANLWIMKNNIHGAVYITDEAQIRREYPTVIVTEYCGEKLEFSKEKRRLIQEVRQNHSRISEVKVT